MLSLPRLPGSKQQEQRKRARTCEGNEEDPEPGSECPICIEPLHLYLLAGCLHRRHADQTLDCCECNTYKAERRARQNALLRDDGALVVLPFTEARPMSASMGTAEMKASELTYSYDGPCAGSYWGDEGEEE